MQARSFLMLPSTASALLSKTFRSSGELAKELGVDHDFFLHTLKPVCSEEHFVGKTLPFFQKLVRDEKLVLFKENRVELVTESEQSVSLSKLQCAWLIGGLFFSLFDAANPATRPIYPPGKLFNIFTLNLLWQRRMDAPLSCILHYMKRIEENSFLRDELVTFSRFSLPKTFVIDETKKLLDVIVSATLPIEDSKAPLHADFANKFPGGGALDGGCVQEEILFVIKPVLDDSTAFTIRNAERFSNYSGYARSWKFAGDCLEKESNQTVIVGIDATVNRFGQADQFGEANHMRDIRKCIAGILPFSGKQFATGGWGTGAFGCDKHHKFLQQWIAVSAVGSDMLYCTFNDKTLSAEIEAFVAEFKDCPISTVQSLFREIRQDFVPKNALLIELTKMKNRKQ